MNNIFHKVGQSIQALISHTFHHEPAPALPDESLYVIAVVSNPVGYASRYQLYREFEQRMLATPGVTLITVEQQINDRPFAITDSNNPNHLQLMGDDRHFLWIKEGLINAGIRHLTKIHPDWKYMAWVDADIIFTKPTWVQDTVAALKTYDIVQPWSHAIDLAADGSPVNAPVQKSFGSIHAADPQKTPRNISYGIYGHPGYAWAMTREAAETLDGVLDWGILGSGDVYMAYAFVGDITKAWKVSTSPGHDLKALEYQAKVDKLTKGFGYISGTICHYWHGSKATRYYVERREILISEKFDPYVHITIDENCLPVPTDVDSPLLKRIKAYMFSRKEDDKK